LTEPCDLLIEPRWLIPVHPQGLVLEQHSLAVRADKIVGIGPVAQMRQRFAAQTILDRPEHALIPGLVNAHVHSAMTLLRGLADDYALMPWLNEHIWPAEARWLSAEFVRDGTTLAIAEQFSCGVTTMNETYFFPDVAAEVAVQYGMRACIGAPIIEFPTAWAPDIDGYFAKANIFLEQYKNHPMIRATLAPHAPYTVSDSSFLKIGQLSQDYNAIVHCHVHETAHEIHDSQTQYGMRPLARLDQLGIVNQRLAAVHMTQLLPEEMALLAERGASVLHCPESNLKLASGFCPVNALIKAGVNMALGTDGCASNNDLDLLGELKTAALLAKAVAQDATALSAPQALTMATLGGARALGLADSIGSLEVGKQAD
jgi:5-methylthioadenosine/S-adenosylhomocysteine deaminase